MDGVVLFFFCFCFWRLDSLDCLDKYYCWFTISLFHHNNNNYNYNYNYNTWFYFVLCIMYNVVYNV